MEPLNAVAVNGSPPMRDGLSVSGETIIKGPLNALERLQSFFFSFHPLIALVIFRIRPRDQTATGSKMELDKRGNGERADPINPGGHRSGTGAVWVFGYSVP
jgi:hypothetical protein